MKSAAEPVGLAVFLGFIMLLAILVEPVMALDRASVLVDVVLPLRCAFGFLASAVLPVQAFDERRMALLAMLSFGVLLRSLLDAVLRLRHESLAVDVERNRGLAVRIR